MVLTSGDWAIISIDDVITRAKIVLVVNTILLRIQKMINMLTG
jgi:hypothetical protein